MVDRQSHLVLQPRLLTPQSQSPFSKQLLTNESHWGLGGAGDQDPLGQLSNSIDEEGNLVDKGQVNFAVRNIAVVF